MKYVVYVLFVPLILFCACLTKNITEDSREGLVSKGFIDNNSYSIVCKGFPKEDLGATGRVESSKRAALLTAYYYAQQVFNDTIAPDRDGKVDKFELSDNYAIVYYIITKQGLRKYLRKD